MSMNGTDILIWVEGNAVGSQRDVTIEETTEEIDVSSKDSRAKRVLAGRYSATLSLDALYVWTDDGYRALRDAMRDGNLILVAREDDGTTIETADALVTSLSESFPDQGEGTISISLDALYVPTGPAYLALQAAMRNGDFVEVVVIENGIVLESADAIVTSLSRNGPDQGEATCSCALRIDGAWVSGS